MKKIEELEQKQEILSEEEKEKYIKNLKIANENEGEADPDLMCIICTSFPHNPVVCNGCKFKACSKCFDEHKLLNKDDKCMLCKEKVPEKNINFNNLRDNLQVFCGNEFCIDPKKKIIFKHYEDHLILCLQKQKCPNDCGANITSQEKAKIHFAQCKQCDQCLQLLDLNNISQHDCKINIQIMKAQKQNLCSFFFSLFQKNQQFNQLNEIFKQQPDLTLMTPEQIQTFNNLEKLTVLKIIENSQMGVTLDDEILEIKINKYFDGRYTHGQIDKTSGVNQGMQRDYGIFGGDKTKTVLIEGQFINGKSHGFGRAILPDGSYYEGQWIESKKHGFGKYSWINGQVYIGLWEKDLMEGQGKYIWPNGTRYEGNWKEDLKDGQGKYYYENGNIYAGSFKLGNFHGQGKITDQNGNIIQEGSWISGAFQN